MANAMTFFTQLAQRFDFRALIRYGVVGVGQNLASYAVILVLLTLGVQAWQAMVVLYPVAVLVTFLINRGWSFQGRDRHPAQLARYVIVYVVSYPLAVAMVWALERGGTPGWAASAIAIVAAAIWMFGLMNLWVFRR